MPFVNAGSNNFAYDSRIFWDSTNGRLGIGTPTPQRRLHVAGQIARFRSSSTSAAAIEISASNNDNNVVLTLRGSDGNNAVIANDAGGNIYLRPDGQGSATNEFLLTNSGRFRANQSGTAGSPTLSFTDDDDTGIYRTGADSLAVSAGGTARFIVNTSEVRVGVSLVLSPFTGIIRSDNNTGVNVLAGGDGTNNGAAVVVYGGAHSGSANQGQLRADGSIIASWAPSNFTVRLQSMTLSHASESRIVRANNTGLNLLSGGTTWNDGAVVRVYGSGHATQANRGALYSGSTLSAYWQDGVFSVPNTLSLSGATGVIRSEGTAQLNVFSGGNGINNGANVAVHGSTHSTQANRGQLRSGTSVKAYWASFGFVIPNDSALIIPVKV